MGGGLNDPNPGQRIWLLGHGMVREVEQYQLEIVGLASTHSLGSGTQHLERRWTLFYSGEPHGEEILTLTGDIVGQWKEYFKDLLNPTDTPSVEEAEAEDSGIDSLRKGTGGSAKVLSFNISDVKEADEVFYLFGVWNKIDAVGYYSYFTEIRLHVTGSSVIIISVCVCVTLLLIGGFVLMLIYKLRHKRTQ
ncbi:hypothetical protein QTP70_004026, partial [Hemibagrus guttatus]